MFSFSPYTFGFLSFCPQSEDGNLVFNPGATLAVEIPAKLLIANASSAGTDGGSAAAAPAATIDVAEKMNMMFEQLAEMKGDLAAANVKIARLTTDNAELKTVNIAMKEDHAALKTRVEDLEAAAANDGTVVSEGDLTAVMVVGGCMLPRAARYSGRSAAGPPPKIKQTKQTKNKKNY